MLKSVEEFRECPDCASMNIVHNIEKDQLICKDCGLIFAPLAPGEEERFEVAHGLADRSVLKKYAKNESKSKKSKPVKKKAKKVKAKSKKKKR